MKKWCNILLTILALFTCVLFSACGDNKYKNLQMVFIAIDGNPIGGVELLIDDEIEESSEEDKSKQTIGVKFIGIKAKDVGQISVKTSPLELASISNIDVDKGLCTFDISANVSGSGEIVVTHKSSGKTASIDLKIGQKSNSLELKETNYVISTSSETHTIDVNSIITLLPNGSTDKVYFKMIEGSTSVSGVTPIFLDDGLFNQINVSESVKSGEYITVYPITYTEITGSSKPYEQQKINIYFVKGLTNEDINLETNPDYYDLTNAGTINNPISLIANDSTLFNNEHRFNSMPIQIKATDEDVLQALNFYNFVPVSDDYNISAETIGVNSAVVIAYGYTNNKVKVQFKLVPKYAGNLSTIAEEIYVKGEEKPTKIEIYQQNKLVESGTVVDIYNYYANSSNALGALFAFVPKESYSFASLQTLRLELAPSILNAKYTNAIGSEVGVNPIYTSSEFSEEITKQALDTNNAIQILSRNNSHVLEIYKFNQPLKFYYDSGKVISEKILPTDKVYIKYSEIENSNVGSLSLNVQTYYTGNETYLKDITCVSERLLFNSVDGVRSVNVGAGHLDYTSGASQVKYEDETAGKLLEANDIFINRLEGIDSEVNTYLLHLFNVEGIDGIISESNFTITVNGGRENPLKILQYGEVFEDAKDPELLNSATTQIADYAYIANDITNSILLLFDKNTDVGTYTITIEHKSNETPLKTIKCKVYQQANSNDDDDFSIDFATDEYNIENTNEFKSMGYHSDYIIAQGSTISMEINISQDIQASGMLKNYINTVKLSEYNEIEAKIVDIETANVDNYVTVTQIGNRLNVTFNKATYDATNLKNQYITLYFGAMFDEYDKLITKKDNVPPVTNSITIFVYEKVSIDNLEILGVANGKENGEVGELTLYYTDTIGWYYSEETTETLYLNFKENNSTIWNYVQNYSETKKVNWYDETADQNMVGRATISADNITLKFSSGGNDGERFNLYAEIKQFGHVYTKNCFVTLKRAVLTDRLVITSPVQQDSFGNLYIDLEVGQEFEVTAKNYSNSANMVSHGGIVLAVVDTNYIVNDEVVYTHTKDNKEYLTVRDTVAKDGLTLYVLAKDLLTKEIKTNSPGFENVLINWFKQGDMPNTYANAYVAIELRITDGSATNPYVINDAEDFWHIGDENKIDKNFIVMNDIDLSNITTPDLIKTISSFKGTITTFNSQIFTISGIELNSNMKNLINDFSGTMQNLKFKVKYNYQNANGNLGLIGVNNGTLTNVGVEISGSATLTNTTTFGGLVAENKGTIEYTEVANTLNGVKGEITLNGSASTTFGGLVGKNVGTITGNYGGNIINSSTADYPDVSFITNVEADGAMANLVVNSYLTGTTTIGLVCGLNTNDTTNGTIKNVHVIGSITHAGVGNVGGVVGENSTTSYQPTYSSTESNSEGNEQIDEVSLSDANWVLENVKSSVEISTNTAVETNYVGGIVGKDKNGTYKDCHYQILVDTTGILGGGRVGGIAGYTQDGVFQYCSVMSYRWDYANLAKISGKADISGKIVGGLIGEALTTMGKTGDFSNVAYSHGVGNKTYTTLINLCSVNAYLQATNKIYGFIGSNNNVIIFNAYVMGKLENTSLPEDKLFDGNFAENSFSYNVYIVTSYANSDRVNSIGEITAAGWAQNANFNGGYAYISKDGTYPIYEIAPTSLTTSVSSTNLPAGATHISENVIRLAYYEFMLDTTSTDYVSTLNALNSEFNTYSLESLFTFAYLPEELRNVQLNVTSSRESVVTITQGNKLVVKGVGKSVLTFSSVINPNIKYMITVDVDYPMGDRVVISESEDDETLAIANVNIAKGKAKMFYVVATGYKQLAGFVGDYHPKYYYRTNSNIELEIKISYPDGGLTDEAIKDYLIISGAQEIELDSSLSGTPSKDSTVLTYKLLANTPFSISVNKFDESITGKFKFNIRPYIAISGTDAYNTAYNAEIVASNNPDFNLYLKEGATGVSLGQTSAVIYPNDVTVVTAYISTDYELEPSELLTFVDAPTVNGKTISVSVKESSFNGTNLQTVKYSLDLSQFEKDSAKSEMELTLNVNKQTASASFTILPQRINKIEISNYIYEGSKITEKNVLKQEGEDCNGLIIIDMAPYNGYFDYLEITDISDANYLIDFQQVKNINGEVPTDQMDTATADGRGIILRKLNSFNLETNSSIYVSTAIDKNATTAVHRVKVSAYCLDENGNSIFLTDNIININVQMLPTITVEYLTPDEDLVATQKTNENAMNAEIAKYVAVNTETKFRVSTANSTGEVEIKHVSNGTFKKDENRNNIYVLNTAGTTAGENIQIILRVRAIYTNGTEEVKEITLNFTVVNFVVYGVTVSPTTSTSPNTIYGNYGVDVPIQFSFEYGDIAYNGRIEESTAIGDILEGLNSGNYLTLGTLTGNSFASLPEEKKEGISLNGNKLRVESDAHKDTKVQLQYYLELSSGNWVLTYDVSEIKYGNIYNIGFIQRMSALNMEVIKDDTDFKNMASGDAYYILGNDITLENYTPIDVDIKQFDGNGRTITIKSFATSTDTEAQYGLFKQIRKGMAVINVVVKYDGFGSISTSATDIKAGNYIDLAPSGNVAYTSVNFGGITATNNGVISNCKVIGDIAIEATQLEDNVNASSNNDFSIPFNVGGLVAVNSSTGYITHSTVEARIVAQANIGGFAYSNSGKIASSGFNANNGKGLIYAYKTGLTTSITVEVAGFIINNSGSISMCYTEIGKTTLGTGNKIGNMSSKNESAGFVYTNSGNIKESYIIMETLGKNHNKVFGFVHSNSGSISVCYSYINSGNKTNSVSMFASEKTTGITNCIEIMNKTSGYKHNVQGLTTIYTEKIEQQEYYYMFNQEVYADNGFVFGDNKSGATFVMSGSLPKLTATQEVVEYTAGAKSTETTQKDENGNDVITFRYYGLRDYVVIHFNEKQADGTYIIKEEKQTIELDHGSKTNPYIIYSMDIWNLYFDKTQNDNYSTANYYRLATDLDFSSVYTDLITSNQTFNGNLQGNNLTISGIRVYSSAELMSVGLFKELVGGEYNSITNTIRNLNISALSINATKTNAVGVLAGIAENFNLYNITLDSNGLVILGGNAVGGVVGLVRGAFDIESISSNVGVTSVREVSGQAYSIYNSVPNGKTKSENLESVYYAGSVFGILDGYKTIDVAKTTRTIGAKNYVNVKNISVTGSVALIGDSVGGAFGFVGENVHVTNVSVKVNGDFAGSEYSGGIVGENRGIIENAISETTNETTFERSKYVSAGIAGLNLGGLIKNSSSTATIINTKASTTAGGIVGRNIGGFVVSSIYNGRAKANYTGGILGSDYSFNTLNSASSGSGAISSASKENILNSVTYKENGKEIKNYKNVQVGEDALNYWLSCLTDFYYHEIDTVLELDAKAKVLGLFVGLTDDERYNFLNYRYESLGDLNENGEEDESEKEYYSKIEVNNGIIFNTDIDKKQTNDTLTIEDRTINHTAYFVETEVEKQSITYLIGSKISTLDSWLQADYCESYMLIICPTPVEE